MNRQVGSCSWDGGHMVRLGHYLPMSSPLTTPMPVSVKPSTPTAVNPSNPMSLTHDRPTSPMFRTQTVTTPSPQSTPSLPRSSPWDTAKSRMVQLNSKCGANCRHAGRSSTSGGSPESSEPNSPTISRMDNHSQNCNVSASQPMDIPTPKRGVSPVCNYLDNSSRYRRSSLIASQGSIRVTSPPMRRRNSLIATQSSFKITSPPMRRRSSLIATQSSFKITSPPVPRCNNVIATQSSFTITSPPMRRRGSLLTSQSHILATNPPVTCKTPVSGDSWEPRSNCQSDYCSEDSRSSSNSPVHQSKNEVSSEQDSPVHQSKTTGTGKQGSPVHQSKTGKRRDSIESLSNSSRSSSSSDLSGSSSLRSSHTRPRNSRSGSKRSRTLENTSASDTTIVNSSFAVPSGRKTSVSPAPRTQKPRKEINAERDMQKEIKGLLITAVKGDQQKNIKESPVASERDQQKVIAESPIIAEGNQQEGITEPPIAVEGYQQESIRGLLVSGDNDLPHFGKHQSETDKSRKSNGVNGVETKSTDSSENTKSMADSEKKTTAATGNIDTMIENLNKSRRSTGNVNGRSRSIIDDIVRSKNITESGRKSKTLIDIEKKTRNLSDIVKSKSFTDYTRKPKVSSDETKKPKVLTDDAKKLRSSVDDTKTRRSLFDDMKGSKSLSDDARKTKYLSETPKKPTNDMRRPRSLCDSTRKPKSLSEDSKKSKSASDTQSNTLTAAIQNFKSSVDVGKKSLGVSSEVQKTRSLFSGDEDGSKPKTIHNKVRKQNTSSDDLRKIKVSNGSNRETSLNGIANRPATLSNNKTNRVTSNTLNKNNPLIIIGDVNKSEVSGNDEVDGLMTGWAMSDSGIMTGDEDNSPMEFLHIPSIVVENTAATDDEDKSTMRTEDRSWLSEAQLQVTDDEDRPWPSEAQLQATDDEDRSWLSEAQLQATDDEDRSWPSEAQLQATDDEDRSWPSEAQLQATDDGTEDRPWPSEAQLQATDGEDRSWPSEAQPQATDGEDRSWVGETQSLAMDDEFPDGRWIDDVPVMDGEIGETGHLVMDNKDDSETDCEHELSRGNVEENDMWENFQLVPSSPTTQIQPYKRVSREGSMFDTAWMSQSWHGCEEFMGGNFDLAMESGEVSQRHLYSTYRKNNNREHRSRSSSVGSDRSSSWGRRGRSRSSSISSREDSRCNSRASNCKEVSCSRNSSSIDKDYGTKGGILDPCPLSRSVGEEFMGYHRRSMTKFGSLTNICDSFRPRVRGVRDSYSSSRSLGNLHETLTGSIANLKTARSPIRGNFGAKDEILEKLDTMMHKYKGSRSTSCLNKDLARGNFDKMVPWGSVRKLPEGWENIKQCVTNKTTLQDPQAVAGMTYKKERLPEKRISHRWEKLRLKVLEKKRRVNRDKANSVFQEGGGEEESEWVNAGEVKGDAPLKGLQSRTPRFSEIFGGNKDVRKARQEMIDGSRDQTMGKKRKSRKRKSKGMPRSKEKGKDDTKTMEWKYTKSLSASCGMSMNDIGIDLVRSRSEEVTPHSDAEEKNSQESGIGSSFEDESKSGCSSAPSSPSTPNKVFDAITHYLHSFDMMDSEEELDSFNEEAEVLDPNELMLLTDNEDIPSWNDLIVSYEGHKGPGDSTGWGLQDDYADFKLDFSTTGNSCVRDEKINQTLGQLLGDDFPSLGSLGWEHDTAQVPNKHVQEKTTSLHLSEVHQMKSSKREEQEEPPASVPVDAIVKSVSEATLDHQDKVTNMLATIRDALTDGVNDNEDDTKDTDLPEEQTNTPSPSMSQSADTATPETPPTTQDTEETGMDNPRGRSRTKEETRSKESGTAERSVSCSDNIKAFLTAKPCAGTHKKGKHSECGDKHQLDATSCEASHNCHQKEDSSGKGKASRHTSKQRTSRRAAEARRNRRQQEARTTNFWSRLFCTTPVTVEGIAPDLESHDTDPEPLPPPIPPHGVDPTVVPEVRASSPLPVSDSAEPEVMTADEAQRLLSAKESQGLLSDEEAQEVVLLLSPQEQDISKVAPPVPPHLTDSVPGAPPRYSDMPPAVPPHYADSAPPVPPHYTPGEDEYDTRVASHFDPTLTSPLSPEEEPSEADSSEASGDICKVSRVKEVLVEDGVHYLEDGHFWVEVPGLPDEDEDEDIDPNMPFHPHTKLTFSKDPVQVFSTYSVTEYDRKNDDVDPVAASAEYELEKRVEKMDLFPVEIVKGEGGLGLSIIGMGVGADAGVEKLGIFVKTITPNGATERDARIQVNDQIIEVDGKSLVGVTQVFAASVLKNTSGRVHFLIGREKDPENSEVALLIKQSLQADREREERRRALGGPDYDPHTGHTLFDPLSSPSEENSRSEEASVQHNYASYMEGAASPTSPEAATPPPEVFDLEGDTSDTSPENDVTMLKLKLKEVQYKHAVAEAEITKLKMTLLEMEKVVTENTQYTSQLLEAQNKMTELDGQLQSKLSEVSTYQDMLEQSQGQFIVLEKKYYKAKKIIKEYQGRERDFLHREEYHITQLEDKDSHYNALVKALKDRVIHLEAELTNAQKKAGMPVQVPTDPNTQPAYWNLQQSAQSALAKSDFALMCN